MAFGTITQLVLENIPSEELQQVIDFCIECGLPVTLEQLGAGKIDGRTVDESGRGSLCRDRYSAQ